MKATSFLAVLIVLMATPARAEWVMQASGRWLTSLPMHESFDSESYVPEIVWVDDQIATFAHEPTMGWQGSGAPRFTLLDQLGEDNTGIGAIFFPTNPPLRTIHVRWLTYYGPDYVAGQIEGTKALILGRCNADCSDAGASGQRGMVVEHQSMGFRTPSIAENIEATGEEPPESGKTVFDIAQHLGEWVSYEAEFDLEEGVSRLFIDTEDGEQQSANGTAPYKVWTDWDTSNAWLEFSWLMGYWEARQNTSADSYYVVDELVIDTQYIGPPPEFGGSSSTSSSASAGAGGSSSVSGGATTNGAGGASHPMNPEDTTATGCACRAGASGGSSWYLVGFLAAAWWLSRRRLGALAGAAVLVGCTNASDDAGSGAGGGTGTNGSSSSSSTASGGNGSGGGTTLPCGAFPSFEDGLSPSSEIHVATNGSDSSGNGSASSPYASIGRALQDAQPGAGVVIHAGSYAGGINIDSLAGTAEAPIWIGGASGEERPLLQGGDSTIMLRRARYVVLHDMEIAGATYNGINADDGSDYANGDAARYIVFRGLDVHDVGSAGNEDCLKLSGLNDYWVLDSHFAHCGGPPGSAIDHVGCHQGIVAGNTFEQLTGNAVQCKGGSENIIIMANHFVAAGERAINMGGSTGFEYFRPPLSTSQPNAEARNIQVIANLIEGSYSPIAFVGCVDCLAANNTLVNPEHWVFRILQETTSEGGYTFLPASNSRIVNNLIYFQASQVGVHVNVGPDTDAQSFVFETNLWYAHDNPGASQPQLPVAETGGLIGTDPSFANAGAGDFHIPASSPAAAAGTAVAQLAGDYDGACFADPPSIGAFQPTQ